MNQLSFNHSSSMESTYRLLGIIIFLLLNSAASGSDDKDKKKSPTGNVNLSPFEEWRSAYECILTEPNPCSTKNKLTMSGELSVSKEETKSDYCQKGGCGEHNQNVLTCIHYVKRDFWFANKATVKVLQDAISNGCSTSSEINTISYQKGAANKYRSISKSLMLALPTVLFLLSFNM